MDTEMQAKKFLTSSINIGKLCSMTLKKRFSVNDVVEQLGISRKTLYNWEAAGKIPKPKRDPMNNYRYWTDKDFLKLKKITRR